MYDRIMISEYKKLESDNLKLKAEIDRLKEKCELGGNEIDFDKGYNEGFDKGYDKGRNEGYSIGYSDGSGKFNW